MHKKSTVEKPLIFAIIYIIISYVFLSIKML